MATRAPLHPFVVAMGQQQGLLGVVRQQPEKMLEALALVAEVGRKLPQDRTQLLAQIEQPRCKKIRQRLLHFPQAADVGDVTAALHAEQKIFGRVAVPLLEALGLLHRVERPVDLDR
jgi:hypothetical protein